MAAGRTLDYSKWDKLELSDDEDFECHPNVDKKSMIRWKQRAIHRDRLMLKDQLELLTLEHQKSSSFIQYISDKIIPNLKSLPAESNSNKTVVEMLLQFAEKEYTDVMKEDSMNRIKSWPPEFEPPVWGSVLKNHQPWHEEVKNILTKCTEYTLESTQKNDKGFLLAPLAIQMLEVTLKKYSDRQVVIKNEIDALKKKQDSKITMDNLTEGFSKSEIVKKPPTESPSASSSTAGKGASQKTMETIHDPGQLKPIELLPPELADEILNEFEVTDENLQKVSPFLLEFSKLKDFSEIQRFITKNPTCLKTLQNEKCEETLLLRALVLQILAKPDQARCCIITSNVLKFTRNLWQEKKSREGRDSDMAETVQLFFSRLATGSSAQALFFSDVDKTLEHIKNRSLVLRKERMESWETRAKEAKKHQERIMEIYNQFKQPDGSFKWPEPVAEANKPHAEWFGTLPRSFQEGMLLEDVDKINEYLSSLDPKDAEYAAKMASEAGFIQFEEVSEEEAS